MDRVNNPSFEHGIFKTGCATLPRRNAIDAAPIDDYITGFRKPKLNSRQLMSIDGRKTSMKSESDELMLAAISYSTMTSERLSQDRFGGSDK